MVNVHQGAGTIKAADVVYSQAVSYYFNEIRALQGSILWLMCDDRASIWAEELILKSTVR